MASTRRQAANGRQRLTGPGDWQRTAGDEHAQRRRAPSNRPLRPSKGVMAESGTMGPFCKVNYSRKGEWLTARNTLCLMGGNINFMAKLHPAKNRPPSRHSWHRNTIPMHEAPFAHFLPWTESRLGPKIVPWTRAHLANAIDIKQENEHGPHAQRILSP